MKRERIIKVISRKAFIIPVIAAILITLAALYWRPKPIERTFYACSQYGEVVSVEFHLKWQRLFFSPNELKGYIVVDGTYFYSPFGYEFDGKLYQRRVQKFSFSEGLKIKLSGDMYLPMFEQGDENGKTHVMSEEYGDYLSVNTNKRNLHYVQLTWFNTEKSRSYFGPAQNAEVAQYVAEKYIQNKGE